SQVPDLGWNSLLRLLRWKIDAALLIRFARRIQIKLGQRHFLRALLGENPERLSNDGVVADFSATAVAVYQECGRKFAIRRSGRGRRRGRSGRGVGIDAYAFLSHLVRQAAV